MTALEEIKKALESVGPLKVEFMPDCDEFNAIIAPINDDYDGTFFTVIGCGDKQDKLGGFMAVAVNAVPELVSTLESLQRENEELRKDRYDLAYAITGGEDAPGLLDTVPATELVDIARDNHRSHSADIDRAEAAERDRDEWKRLHDAAQRTVADRNSALNAVSAQNEALRKLLQPFAAEAENWHDSVPDDHRTLCTEPNSTTAHPGSEADFTVGDLRRARTALASTGGEHHAE